MGYISHTATHDITRRLMNHSVNIDNVVFIYHNNFKIPLHGVCMPDHVHSLHPPIPVLLCVYCPLLVVLNPRREREGGGREYRNQQYFLSRWRWCIIHRCGRALIIPCCCAQELVSWIRPVWSWGWYGLVPKWALFPQSEICYWGPKDSTHL